MTEMTVLILFDDGIVYPFRYTLPCGRWYGGIWPDMHAESNRIYHGHVSGMLVFLVKHENFELWDSRRSIKDSEDANLAWLYVAVFAPLHSTVLGV